MPGSVVKAKDDYTWTQDSNGRPFVQLTGHDNYVNLGSQIGVDLIADPDLANHADIAAKILARFLKNAEAAIRKALRDNNLAHARKLVNGGSNGLTEFQSSFAAGRAYLHVVIKAKVKLKAKPKAKK